ncbi:MAG: Mov34/MPN/PAD-1 family protein [Acidimicrobiia bacterium]|nr:Mov34/MPN/PAD-1 family protein [Acidimicrobiia bacterium]
MVDDPLVTVGSYSVRSDAEIARAALDASGVDAVVRADDEGGLNPGFFAEYGVRVEVRAGDVDAARSILGVGLPEPILELPQQVTEAVVAHARFTYPEEACGLLAVDDAGDVRMVYCLTNVERSRYRFTVDPNEHYRAWRHAERNGWEIGGAFHSHPMTAAHPSSTDIAGALDPTWVHLIVGLVDPENPEVRAFRIVDGEAAELGSVTLEG